MGVVKFAAALVAALCVVTVSAESGPREGQFYFSALGAYYKAPNDLDLDDNFGPGGAVGWAFHDQWSAEIEYFALSPDIESTDEDTELDMLSLNALYRIPVGSNFQPYAVFGFGMLQVDDNDDAGYSGDDDNVASAGIGFFYNLHERFAVRGDVRGLYHNENEDITPFATIGATLFLGNVAPKVLPDADGDGVPDSLDKCPGTPTGRSVDANGCERDSDGDGVVDGVDQCPNTPAGVKVDSRGCPPDSDGDGVTDDVDKCPNTPRGTRVDATGCPVVAETTTFNLTVEFAFNSAEINEIGVQELFKAIRFLREHPDTVAEIEGHTDSVGGDDYNQGLSERRANAIKQAIVNSGIDASRMEGVGYGESRPIASNDTDEGRQKNRRVTIVASQAKP